MAIAETDYIVVGAGSAGCVVAGRLSEDPSVQVTVFEAGRRNDSIFVRWPAGFARLQTPENRWDWQTVPQNQCGGRRVPTPQGKLVGGGSAVNGMVYIRGNRRDYDAWAALGNDRWSYDEVLPYFRMSEDNAVFAGDYHGTEGALGVSDQISPSPLTRLFVRAAQESGIPYNPDFNGERQSGAGFYQVTQRNAQRCSAAHAFLYPAMTRPNLVLRTQAQVTRILIEKGRAVGIEYRAEGSSQRQVLRARREVIVSAGAINSPKLLLLSGIGTADELRSVGIESAHDLPGVGRNLHDHVDAYVCVRLKEPVSYTGQDRGLAAIRHGIEYMLFKTGAVTSNACEGGAFVNSEGSEDWPDVQLHFMPAALATHRAIGGHGITVLCSAVRPKSRGTLRLASADPFADPLIDTNFLSHPDDMRHNIAALRIGRAVVNAPSFRSLTAGEVYPGPDCQTDEQFATYIRQNANTDFHPVGTCKMGSDAQAVVDQDLKVHGIEGLRVIDASIMPQIVSGNTNAPAIMIGERGAAAIRGTMPAAAPSAKPASAVPDLVFMPSCC